MKNLKRTGIVLAVLIASLPPSSPGHEAFAFGEQGDPKKPSRAVPIIMREDGTKMRYIPDTIKVKKGEQIRFVIDNEGLFNHEFVLGTEDGIRSHAAEMKKHPDMQHHDAHSLQVAMYDRGELLWRFTKAGRFVYACLIPGHLERGMRGTVVVK
jgi:uncharacterized cupredoxin-like copper-binding protein